MARTIRDTIKSAYRLLGVSSAEVDADASFYDNGLEALTLMLNSWAAHRLLQPSLVQAGYVTVDGTASYAIGSGSTWNTSKPMQIVSAFIRDSQNIDYPIDVIGRDEYDAINQKTGSGVKGLPDALYYEPGLAQQATQTGTVFLYPVPDAVYTVYINQLKLFTEYAIDDTTNFTPEYERAIKYNLAVELAPEIGVNVQVETAQRAEESMRSIKLVNTPKTDCAALPFGGLGTSNILTDQYNRR